MILIRNALCYPVMGFLLATVSCGRLKTKDASVRGLHVNNDGKVDTTGFSRSVLSPAGAQGRVHNAARDPVTPHLGDSYQRLHPPSDKGELRRFSLIGDQARFGDSTRFNTGQDNQMVHLTFGDHSGAAARGTGGALKKHPSESHPRSRESAYSGVRFVEPDESLDETDDEGNEEEREELDRQEEEINEIEEQSALTSGESPPKTEPLDPDEARNILLSYGRTLEDIVSQIVSTHSGVADFLGTDNRRSARESVPQPTQMIGS